jgi:phosphoribosylformylglycinamidine cyclo-ligase
VIEAVVEEASLDIEDAYRTFNMGIGFMLVLAPADAPAAAAALRSAGEAVYEIGEIAAGSGRVTYR